MADVNIQKRPQQESQAIGRRYDPFGLRGGSFPSVWRSPFEFLSPSPFGMARRFGEDFDRFFNGGWPAMADRDGDGWWPAIDVYEKSGKLYVRADLPGIDKNDVKVEFTDGSLTISGERKREHDEETGGVRRTERSYGSFFRAIPLPEGAHADQARANFKDGVLEVTIPVPEGQRKRTIPIEGETGERKQMSGESAQQRASKAG